MPAAPPPTRAEVQGRAADFPRLFGAGSTVSAPCPPASKIPKGWGSVQTRLAGRTPRGLSILGEMLVTMHQTPAIMVRIRSIDDRTERDGPWQLLV